VRCRCRKVWLTRIDNNQTTTGSHRASSALAVNGFSHSTCLPAAQQNREGTAGEHAEHQAMRSHSCRLCIASQASIPLNHLKPGFATCTSYTLEGSGKGMCTKRSTDSSSNPMCSAPARSAASAQLPCSLIGVATLWWHQNMAHSKLQRCMRTVSCSTAVRTCSQCCLCRAAMQIIWCGHTMATRTWHRASCNDACATALQCSPAFSAASAQLPCSPFGVAT
jgi:hypothetical protein